MVQMVSVFPGSGKLQSSYSRFDSQIYPCLFRLIGSYPCTGAWCAMRDGAAQSISVEPPDAANPATGSTGTVIATKDLQKTWKGKIKYPRG